MKTRLPIQTAVVFDRYQSSINKTLRRSKKVWKKNNLERGRYKPTLPKDPPLIIRGRAYGAFETSLGVISSDGNRILACRCHRKHYLRLCLDVHLRHTSIVAENQKKRLCLLCSHVDARCHYLHDD